MKILFLSKYNRDGASSRYRFYNYKPYFDENCIQFHIKPLLDNSYVLNLYDNRKIKVYFQRIFSILKRVYFVLFQSSNYDLIVIEKELFPNVPYVIEKLLLKGKSYALDFDDYIATDYKLNNFKKLFLKFIFLFFEPHDELESPSPGYKPGTSPHMLMGHLFYLSHKSESNR